MSDMGKILIDPVNSKATSDIDGQSDRDDVAKRVFLREIDVSACSSVENELSSAGVEFQMFRRSILCQRVCQRCPRSSTEEGNAHPQIFLVFFLVWSD